MTHCGWHQSHLNLGVCIPLVFALFPGCRNDIPQENGKQAREIELKARDDIPQENGKRPLQIQLNARAKMDAARRLLEGDSLTAEESEEATNLLNASQDLLQKANAVVHEGHLAISIGEEEYKEHVRILKDLRKDHTHLSANFEKKIADGKAPAVWKDKEDNTHALVSNDDGTSIETITTPGGKTVKTTRGGKETAAAVWKDKEGNTHALASNDDGTRTETITTPDGEIVKTTRGGKEGASAVWKDDDGNTHALVSNDDGTRTETITAPDGKTVKTTHGGKEGASTIWKDEENNTHALASNDDGTRTETITTPDGKTVKTTHGGKEGASAIWKDEENNTHSLASNDDGTRTETITTPDGKTVNSTAAFTPGGNWFAEFHDYPAKGEVTRVRYEVFRQPSGWVIHGDQGNGSHSVAPTGHILIEHGYFFLGYAGGLSNLKQVAPNEIRGRWSYRDAGGAVVWRKAIPKITRIKFTSDIVSEVAFGVAPGRVEGTFHESSWGPGNDMRGNRPRFTIEFYGENLWGHHDIDLLGDPALELWPVYYLFENGRNNIWMVGKPIGITFTVCIWDKFTPGQKTLVVDGMEIPFDFIVKGMPETPQLRFMTKDGETYEELGEQLYFFGGPIFLEARYATKQEDEMITLVLEWSGNNGTESSELSATPIDASMLVYRSPPFFIYPPEITPANPVEPLVSP